MVGSGKLIQVLFYLEYEYAVILVGVMMIIYVTFGGMLATTWVQIIKAVLLLSGVTFMGFMVLSHFGFSFEALATKAVDSQIRSRYYGTRWIYFRSNLCYFIRLALMLVQLITTRTDEILYCW